MVEKKKRTSKKKPVDRKRQLAYYERNGLVNKSFVIHREQFERFKLACEKKGVPLGRTIGELMDAFSEDWIKDV